MAIRYQVGGVTVAIGRSQEVSIPTRVFRGRATCMHFDTDKSFLLPASMSGVRNIVQFYARHAGMSMLINGHTDGVGDARYNAQLSVERASAVAAYLLAHADEWLSWYHAASESKRWGVREDQSMLSAVLDPQHAPYYAGPISGVPDAETRDATSRFQADQGLCVDGMAGDETRRALITQYMAIEGTSLPSDAALVIHGCGKFHPIDATTGADAGNRRVEIFLFDGPVSRPPADPCPAPGCAQYAAWVAEPEEDIDLCTPQLFDLVVVVEDRAVPPQPIAAAGVQLSGPTPGTGTTDDTGVVSFRQLDPGSYSLVATKTGFDAVTLPIRVPGPAQTSAPPAAATGEGPRSSLVGAPPAAAAPPAAPVPPSGGTTVATVKLAARPPTIVAFTITALPARPGDPAAAPDASARVHPKQLVALAWEVTGAFDKLVIEPGAIDLTSITVNGKGALRGQPLSFPPDDDGVYTLTAASGGASATRTVELLGLLDFSVTAMGSGQLTLADGATRVDKLDAVEGSLKQLLDEDRTHPNRPSFVGQITLHAGATFAWQAAGTNKVALSFRSISAGGDSKAIDVTKQTTIGVVDQPPKPDPGGLGKATFLQADLHVSVGGAEIESFVLRLRENRPFPALTDFSFTRKGTRVEDGETMPDWSDVAAHWTLANDFDLNTLSLKITDTHGGVFSTTVRAPGARPLRATDEKPIDPIAAGVTLTGPLTATLTLSPASSRRTLHLALPEPAPPKPPVTPPEPARQVLEVGFNYAWAFNKYGTNVGPGSCAKSPPGGPATPAGGWVATVPATLKQLADMRCTMVRWFVMANGINYGTAPTRRKLTVRGRVVVELGEDFTPPAALDPSFISDFVELLKLFKAFNDDPANKQKLKLLPSLVDFGMFSDSSHVGGGRSDVVKDPAKRKIFLDTVLDPFLAASLPFRDHIFAWEVINEPAWNVRFISPPVKPGGRVIPPLPTVSRDELRTFLKEALARIEVNFQSTVGHRFQSDLLEYPTGQIPQFHYYAQLYSAPLVGDFADPNPIPLASAAPAGRIVGEVGASATQGQLWPELHGTDATAPERVFQRLDLIQAKGYKLCLVWPDLGDDTGTGLLKLSAESQRSLVRFTGGVATGVHSPT